MNEEYLHVMVRTLRDWMSVDKPRHIRLGHAHYSQWEVERGTRFSGDDVANGTFALDGRMG